MRSQILLAVGVLLSSTDTLLLAQDSTKAPETPTSAEEPAIRPLYRPVTLAFEAGTQGILGGFASWRFSDHLGVRAAGDYAEATWHAVGIAGINYNLRVQLLSEPLVLDVYPWKKSSFHVSVGMMLNQNEATGTASDNGTIVIDGQPFPSPLVGPLTMKIKQQPVNPYLSIAGNFFYFDRAHHVAMGGELGVAYTGSPEFSLNRSFNGPSNPALDSALNNARARLHDYADQYKWWPVAKLYVSYSF